MIQIYTGCCSKSILQTILQTIDDNSESLKAISHCESWDNFQGLITLLFFKMSVERPQHLSDLPCRIRQSTRGGMSRPSQPLYPMSDRTHVRSLPPSPAFPCSNDFPSTTQTAGPDQIIRSGSSSLLVFTSAPPSPGRSPSRAAARPASRAWSARARPPRRAPAP